MSLVIRGIWLFNSPLDINVMKAGLKKLLNYYPHLSGRMKDTSGIHLTNEGIPFTATRETELSVADVHRMTSPEKHFSTELNLPRINRGMDAPLSVKVTGLKDGTVLGIQCLHACLDGSSFYTMADNWGRICRKEKIEKPVLDQSLLPGQDNLSKEQALQQIVNSGWKKISAWAYLKLLPVFISGILAERTCAFYFSASALYALKRKYQKILVSHAVRMSSCPRFLPKCA